MLVMRSGREGQCGGRRESRGVIVWMREGGGTRILGLALVP